MDEIETTGDLFAHELATLYYVESELIDVLDELALEARDDEIKSAFADHRDETRTHARRLEDVFGAVDEQRHQERSATLDGIVGDRQTVVEATTDPDLIDAVSLDAGVKIERIEITGYESLLRIADELGYEDDVAEPLNETLDEERDAKQRLTAQAKGSTLRRLLAKIG